MNARTEKIVIGFLICFGALFLTAYIYYFILTDKYAFIYFL